MQGCKCMDHNASSHTSGLGSGVLTIKSIGGSISFRSGIAIDSVVIMHGSVYYNWTGLTDLGSILLAGHPNTQPCHQYRYQKLLFPNRPMNVRDSLRILIPTPCPTWILPCPE